MARELAELKARGGQAPAQPSGGEEAAPKLEDFKEYEDYATAKARWVARQEYRQQVAQAQRFAQEQRAVQTAADIRGRWEAGEAEFRGKVADYDEVMADDSVKFSQSLSIAILDSEVGPQIAYYLKKHPDEAQALRDASPVAAARAIGKLEAKLTAAPPPKPRSQTPAPPQPVRGQAAVDGLRDDEPIDSWIEKRNKQVLERRRR
jgi:hypothetical protein